MGPRIWFLIGQQCSHALAFGAFSLVSIANVFTRGLDSDRQVMSNGSQDAQNDVRALKGGAAFGMFGVPKQSTTRRQTFSSRSSSESCHHAASSCQENFRRCESLHVRSPSSCLVAAHPACRRPPRYLPCGPRDLSRFRYTRYLYSPNHVRVCICAFNVTASNHQVSSSPI